MTERLLTSKPLLFILMMLWSGVAVAANETADALEKQTSDSWSYKSFNEAIHLIEERTGFKVSYPKGIETFMQTIWMSKGRFIGPGWEDRKANTTVKDFLDDICPTLALTWKYNSETNTLSLDLAWKISDPRTPSELLKAVWQPGYYTDYEKDSKWQTAFNALLSNDLNFEKAWRVRQKVCFQRHFLFGGASKPILMKPIVDTSEKKYIFIVVCQPIEMYPGNGSVSYYWFKDDGTLVGAGLMNTGHRCQVVDTTIDNEFGARSDQTSELQMILKMNMREFFIARFALGANGLELTHLNDADGRGVNNDGLNIGQSLMTPDKQ